MKLKNNIGDKDDLVGSETALFDNSVEADRVIQRVSEKLQGIEQGTHLSVEGHVNYLIQTATNKDNLSRIYYGWQAWL